MSTTSPKKPTKEALAQAARALELRGYRVVVEPSGGELPSFLEGYRPDLIAYGDQENLAVEFKADTQYASVRRSSDFAHLVEAQPGWRFVLAFASDDPASVGVERSTLSIDQALARIARSEELFAIGEEDEAFLLLWTAFEGALRRYAAAVDLVVGSMPPSALLRELYSLGEVSWGEFETAMEALKRRNIVAHGFQSDGGHESFQALADLARIVVQRALVPPQD